MKKVTINGVEFEIDYNAPRAEQVYCESYNMFGEFTGSKIIDLPVGRKAVNAFDVPMFGEICIGISEESVYKVQYAEVV
jgi:hypothetical protein